MDQPQNPQLTHFDHVSAEKKGDEATNARIFFAGIWGSNIAKAETKSRDEVVQNDFYRYYDEETDGGEELCNNVLNKLQIHDRKSENCDHSVITYTKDNSVSVSVGKRQGKHDKDGTAKVFTNIQCDTEDYKTRYKTRDSSVDRGKTNIFHTRSIRMERRDKNEYSNVFENIDRTNDSGVENKTGNNNKVLDEKRTFDGTDGDLIKIPDAANITEDNKSGEQKTEEEMRFTEMMSTFDKIFPDDNDSVTLYELVVKQGFKTKTLCLFEAMQELASSKGFEIKDVSPNGNCMFQAVNDQLIINGDFGFDVMSLRQRAVSYLKSHPKNKEEVPLECFLINEETWDAYLTRMSKRNEWGDHLTLKALCEVLGRKILVHNVQSSENSNTYEFVPEKWKDGRKDDLHLGHLGEFHYTSLRPSNWKLSWLSKITRTKEEDPNYMETKKALYDEMVLTENGFDHISKLDMPIFSIVLINLVLLSDTIRLTIPSKIYSIYDNYHIETAGGRADGAEVFYKQKDNSHHRAECCRRCDSECPLMIQVRDDQPVTCSGEIPNQDNYIYAETNNCHPGYCRLLSQSKGRRGYLYGWNVMPQLDPSDTVAKRSVSGRPCHNWPYSAMEWLTRKTRTNWPKHTLRKGITRVGCLVVQIAHPASSSPEIEWRFLFNSAEKKLMETLPPWQKYPYYIFKMAVDFFTKNLKVRLHTVHLKSIFFFACEEFHISEFQDVPGYCFLFMIHNLLNHLKNGCLPNYFIKENNMIDHFSDQAISDIKEMVEIIRVFPQQSLLFLLEEHGHHRSWIIDTFKFGADNLDTYDIIIPTMVRLSQHLARDEQYRSARIKLLDVESRLTIEPFYKNGRKLPTPDLKFLFRESFRTLDEYTKCRLVQAFEDETGVSMFSSEIPTKTVKDLTSGEDIAGLGEEKLPVGISGDDYYEANYMNSLGVSLHFKEKNYRDASRYYFSAIDLLGISSEKLLNDIHKGEPDSTQAERYKKVSDNDSLSIVCFQNLLKCDLDFEIKDHLKDRMPLLEKICKRSHGQGCIDLIKNLWEKLGFPDRRYDLQDSLSLDYSK